MANKTQTPFALADVARVFGVPMSMLQPPKPRSWSILLTSANHGTVGPLGSTFPHAGEKHERVQVVEIVEAGAPPAPGVDLAGLVRFDAAGNQVLLGRPASAAKRAPAQPVGEFQGYVDGEPFVAWADRTRMPQVGDKLYAGVAPITAQAGQVAVPEGDYTSHHFRKKPVVIEAVQWSGNQFVGTPPDWIGDAINQRPGAEGSIVRICDEVRIATLEGDMAAKPGDWIIRGVKGELYPCKPEIFAATYEHAAAPSAPAVAQQAPTFDLCEEKQAALDKQVASWRKERARLDDLIVTATGAQASTEGERQKGGAA